MSRKIYFTSLLLFTAVIFGGIGYAGNGGKGGGSGTGMGGGSGAGMGGGRGMMGGQGHVMMGFGNNYSNSWREQLRTPPTYRYEKNETESLREEIKAKRQELSALYRSEQPNKEMIDQKIAELDELEAKLDEKLSNQR